MALVDAFCQFVHKHPLFNEIEDMLDDALSAAQLKAIEANLGYTLPLSYRTFLTNIGAGYVGFAHILSPDPDSPFSFKEDRVFLHDYCPHVLPFSPNGCGDYYVFPIMDGHCHDRILFADHEIDYTLCDTNYVDFQDFVFRQCFQQDS